MKRKMTVEQRVEIIRENSERYATERLARGSIRLQKQAYATRQEWEDRRDSQAGRMQRITEMLGKSS